MVLLQHIFYYFSGYQQRQYFTLLLGMLSISSFSHIMFVQLHLRPSGKFHWSHLALVVTLQSQHTRTMKPKSVLNAQYCYCFLLWVLNFLDRKSSVFLQMKKARDKDSAMQSNFNTQLLRTKYKSLWLVHEPEKSREEMEEGEERNTWKYM